MNEERKLKLNMSANLFYLFLNASLYFQTLCIACRSPHLSINLKGIKWMHRRTLNLSDEASDGVFLYGFYRSSKEAPRNIAKEAGRTGRNTAGNWCGEQEECLSTKPTQTQASSLNLLFTPQPLGTFLSDISIPPKLEQLLWLCRDVFQDSLHFIY